MRLNKIMVSAYEAEGDAFRAEKPRLWSEEHYRSRGTFRPFDLHPDEIGRAHV